MSRLKKCAFCRKDIPWTITVCPYCRRDEQGQDTAVSEQSGPSAAVLERQIQEDFNLLGHDDPVVRKNAVERISQKGSAVVPLLINLLNEHTHKGLSEVARLLGRLRDRRAAPALVQALKIGDEELHTSAVWALCQLNDSQVLEDLIHESERNNPAVQAYLAHVLAGYQDARVVPALVKLAQNNSREVAFQGVWALGEVGNNTAVLPLRRLLGQRDPLIRIAAETALRRLGGPVRRIVPAMNMVMAGVGTVLAISGMIWYCYR